MSTSLKNVTVKSYGRYSSDNYGLNTQAVTLGDIVVYFSYSTPIAYRDWTDGLVVSVNEWQTTTGKHLNWIDGGSPNARAKRLPRPEFEAKLAAALSRVDLQGAIKRAELGE